MRKNMNRGAILALTAAGAVGAFAGSAEATLYVYEPFAHPVTAGANAGRGISGVNGSAHSSGSGYVVTTNAVNARWNPTSVAFAGNAAGIYAVANDGVLVADDLTVANLEKQVGTNALAQGGGGYTPRLSGAAIPSTTGTAGQSLWYSYALKITDLRQANLANGPAFGGIGSLGGFTTGVGDSENGNPSASAGLVFVRPLFIDLNADGKPQDGEFILDGLGNRQFNIGVSKGDNNPLSTTSPGGPGTNSNGTVFGTSLFSEGQTIFVAGEYAFNAGDDPDDLDDDVARLFINPLAISFETATPLTSAGNTLIDNIGVERPTLASFMFRQSGGSTGSQSTPDGVVFDELRIGTTYADVTPAVPEPAAVSLLALGGLGLLARRRRTVAVR